MRNRFITSAQPVRLQLADVRIRAHQALVDRKHPEPTLDELETSQASVEAAQADGAWIDIKPELSAGETREFQSRMFVTDSGRITDDGVAPAARVDYRKVGFTRAAQYLLGWNLEDEHGIVEVPRGDDDDAVTARERLLQRLDAETFADINAAIEHHETERAKRRLANPTTAQPSEPISASHG